MKIIKTICNILHLVLIVVSSVVMKQNGFGTDTYQWWVVVISIMLANVFGKLEDMKFEK